MELDQEHLLNWLPIIGVVTISWTPIERHIDQCLHFLTLAEAVKSKPTSLNHKLDIIKTKISPAIFSASEIEELVKNTKYIVKIRNILVHGVVVSCDMNKITVEKTDTRKPGHHLEDFTITLEQLNLTVPALQAVSGRWFEVTDKLKNLIHNA